MEAPQEPRTSEIFRDSNPNLSAAQQDQVKALGRKWDKKCKEGDRGKIESFIKDVAKFSDYHVAKQFFMENNIPSSGRLRQGIQAIWQKAGEKIDYYANIASEEKSKLEPFDKKWVENSSNFDEKANTQLLLEILSNPQISIRSVAAFYEKHEIFPEGRFRIKPEIVTAESKKIKEHSAENPIQLPQVSILAKQEEQVSLFSKICSTVSSYIYAPKEQKPLESTTEQKPIGAFADLNERSNEIRKMNSFDMQSAKVIYNFLNDVIKRIDLSKEEKIALIYHIPVQKMYHFVEHDVYDDLNRESLRQFGFCLVDFDSSFLPRARQKKNNIGKYQKQLKEDGWKLSDKELQKRGGEIFDATLTYLKTLLGEPLGPKSFTDFKEKLEEMLKKGEGLYHFLLDE